MAEKSVHITLTKSQMVRALMGKVNMEPRLAELIVGNLINSQAGFEQLGKALLNIYPELGYSVDQFVYVKVDSLPAWKIDRARTLAQSFCRDGSIMAQIITADPYSNVQYEIEFTALDSSGNIAQMTAVIPESYIVDVVEDPVEILNILGNLKKDLPF